MSGELAPKLRVVRCPKCKQLLPEPPNCHVYKCGGCGTTLQAKKPKNEAVKSESGTHKTDAAPRNTNDLVSEAKQGRNRKQPVPSRENGGRGQNEKGECNGEQLGPINLSDEELENEMDIYKLSLRRHRVSNKGQSNELPRSEIEAGASSVLKGDNSLGEANDTSLQLEGAKALNNGKLLLEGAKEDLISAPVEENGDNEESASVGEKSEKEIIRSDLEGVEELNTGNLLLEGAPEELSSGMDREDANSGKSALVVANPEMEIIGAEELNNGNLLLEGAEEELSSGLDREDANNGKSALVDADPEVEVTGSDIAGAKELNNGKLLSEGAEEKLNMPATDGEDPSNDQSALVAAKSEVDITPSKVEEGTALNPVSSFNEQQEQAQKNIQHSFEGVRSVDTFDTTEVINHSSEIGGNLEELSKSPTTRSSYDGSVSSYAGTDEQFPIQHLDSFKNTYTDANGVLEERSRKGKVVFNSMSYGDLETQHQSSLPKGKHHVMKESRWNLNKELGTTSHGHRHWMRTKRDDFPSRMSFHLSGSQSGYESGGPSNQMHDDLYCSSSFLSPDYYEETDQEKMKLLRMIYKLQDQLNGTRYVSGETNGRMSTGVSFKGKSVSAHHSHDLHGGRFYHGLDSCNGRCSHGLNWNQRHKFSRIPYSAEATSSTHHVDRFCFHCRPQYSADLPPHVVLQHEELCTSHPGHNCCACNHSYPSSPQWSTASKVPVYGRETKSDDQRHVAPEVTKYFREKQHLAKRHYRPVAGGAPFVTCHNCSKLLRLPADFLLFKRVCHKVKCGACSEVLKFSLQNGSHIVSYSPNAIGPPPSSDLNFQSEVINSSNLPSPSHANYYQYSHADPISYSDDYGLSVSKSYSSEGDPVSLTPFHSMRGSEYDNTSVSRGTFEPITEKEKIASRHSSAGEIPGETHELAGLSSNMSSEMDARPPPKGLSLLQLMGYSSPSQVVRGTKSPVEGKEPVLKRRK